MIHMLRSLQEDYPVSYITFYRLFTIDYYLSLFTAIVFIYLHRRHLHKVEPL